tara:strand:- start:133 stop:1332 length:1200 start_codon:yes stop_codon:yes gene_type:complete
MKTMTYWNQPYTMAVVGIELEFAFSSSACQSIPHARQVFHDAGFDWIDYRRDGTYEVDIECVFPPLPDCHWLRQQLSAFMDIAVSLGLKYKKKNGLHIHLGKRRLKPATNIELYIQHACDMARNGFQMPNEDCFGDEMQIELIKDIVRRYAYNQETINRFMPLSRQSENSTMYKTIGWLSRPDPSAQLDAITSIEGLTSLIGRNRDAKYNAVNTKPRATIEFRQHPTTTSSKKVMNWISLIIQLAEYSDAHRIRYGHAYASATQVLDTPECPYRHSSNIGQLYTSARREGGATVRDMVQLTGMSAQNIRARFSEIRNLIGQDAVLTYTQQHYNHRYGSSNGNYDLGGYEILTSFNRTEAIASQTGLLPDDQIGDLSIWAGMPYDVVQYFQSGRVTATRI